MDTEERPIPLGRGHPLPNPLGWDGPTNKNLPYFVERNLATVNIAQF